MLIYLDQNYASRVAKHLLGQPSHDAFGEVHRALRVARAVVPPSPFHILETRGGYLLPMLEQLFAEFSQGNWVRPYQEVVRRQSRRAGLDRVDLLCTAGDWSTAASMEPLDDLLDIPLTGTLGTRRSVIREAAAERFGMSPDTARRLPFFDLLARMMAFRSTDDERAVQASDLTDLVMAATVAPYVDALATDRYVAEVLRRVGYSRPLFSGRRPDVLRFADWLRGQSTEFS